MERPARSSRVGGAPAGEVGNPCNTRNGRAGTYAQKATELRDEVAQLRLQIEAIDRGRDEIADLAVKAFELSQSLQAKWVTSDYDAKRRILEIVCLNWRLDDVSLVPVMRKPFDMLAEGLSLNNSRGDRT